MKRFVSLSNGELADKKQMKNMSQNFFLKPTHLVKFINETLFYIFYYMPRDSLQLYVAEELYRRGWKYHTDYSVWFTNDNNDEKSEKMDNDNYLYFNQLEWKVAKYVYGKINPAGFLAETEVFKYNKSVNTEK